MFKIKVSSHTDIGDVKQTNQDCIFSRTDVINNHNVGIFIVADGCGGLAYGEEISKLIVTYFSRLWSEQLSELLKSETVKVEDIYEMLEKAVLQINRSALDFSRQVNSKVGSTLSLLLTIDNRYYIKNVGDSRIYRIRGKRILQLTEDQSVVAELIRSGQLTREDAKNFKRKNVLTMCIGFFDELHTYTNYGKIKNGDIFLLCCDGLHNHIEPEEVLRVVKNASSFEETAQKLREQIPLNEATDNVSSVVCRFSRKNRLSAPVRIMIKLLLIALAVWLCFSWGHIKEHLKLRYETQTTFGGLGIHCSFCGELIGAPPGFDEKIPWE